MTTTPVPESAPDPTAQERVEWLGKNSKRLIIALIVIIVAALIVAFSFSLFNTSSANPGNTVTSGIMEQSNSKEGQAILIADKMLPGDTATGTVSITNVGDADGDFTLTASALVDTPASPAISSVLALVVTDDNNQTVYSGPLAGSVTASPLTLGKWPGGAKHDYTFTVTFPATAGNEYQGAKAELDFTWNATQSS